MARYASKTTVPVEKSRAEIEKILSSYGANAFRHGWDQSKAVIEFAANDRLVRFVLPVPVEAEFSTARAHDQACRQRWRALVLTVKAKLEAVESGISLFEQEFLAHIVDPSTGRTVYESISAQLQVSYQSHDPAPLLLAGPRRPESEAR